MIDQYAPAVIIGLFLAIVAHSLTIGRDKRREFNEVVIPLRAKLLKEAANPSPDTLAITRNDADAVSTRIWWIRRRGFIKCCDAYWNAHSQTNQDSIGQVTLNNKEHVIEAAKKLLPYLSPR